MSTEDPLIGVVVGDYRIEERIGKGGMGVVHLARQLSLDRPVAIKLLPAELCADREYVDRFLREARAAAHLNHPNVVQIFDAGVSENIYFFVMEYMDGKNLGQIVRESGPLEEYEALHVIQQTAEGLAFAHRMGVIHRDVKPENIMISSHGGVKIGDLGLAKWKPNEYEASLTSTGTTMGTPFYISPEQIRGIKDIDGRTDIYSLGMTLYHLLAGKPAFGEGSAAEIMARHLSDPIPPLDPVRPGLSAETTRLVHDMTLKDRNHRIQDMDGIAETIADALGQVRTSTPRRGLRRKAQLQKPPETDDLWSRILATGVRGVAAGIVGLLLAAVIILAWKSTHRKAHLPPLATPSAQNVEPFPATPPLQPPPSESKTTRTKTVHPPQPFPPAPQAPAAKATPSRPAPAAPQAPVTKEPAPPARPTPATPQVATPSEKRPAPPPPAPAPVAPAIKEPAPPPAAETHESPAPVPMGPRELRIQGELMTRECVILSRPEDNRAPRPTVSFRTDQAIPQRLLYLMEWPVAKSGRGEVKTLLRFNLLAEDSDLSRRLLARAKDCTSAILEITPLVVTPESREIEVEVCRLLKPWGQGKESPDEDPAKSETNWKFASKGRAWTRDGAGGRGFDYENNALSDAQNPNRTSFPITAEDRNQPLRLNVLPEFQRVAQEPQGNATWPGHYGWIVQVARGTGEVRFASSHSASDNAPALVLTFHPPTTAAPHPDEHHPR